MTHVVLLSGGIASWYAGKLVAKEFGTANLVCLFCDTKMEDPDLYRFLREAHEDIGGQLITLCDGRTPWQIFRDVRFLGNSRIDPCSKILKRDISNRWFEENFTRNNVIRYVGYDWSEEHRYLRMKENLYPWIVKAPLIENPIDKWKIKEKLKETGIKIPRLYDLGFDHNNCGGFCIKAGHGHFNHLQKVLPEVYAYHEAEEKDLIEYLDKPVTILSRVVEGKKEYLTLEQFRQLNESEVDLEEIGGCGCFGGPLEAQEEQNDS